MCSGFEFLKIHYGSNLSQHQVVTWPILPNCRKFQQVPLLSTHLGPLIALRHHQLRLWPDRNRDETARQVRTLAVMWHRNMTVIQMWCLYDPTMRHQLILVGSLSIIYRVFTQDFFHQQYEEYEIWASLRMQTSWIDGTLFSFLPLVGPVVSFQNNVLISQ